MVARNLLAALRSSLLVGVLVGLVTARRDWFWSVVGSVVVALDIIPRVVWKGIAGLSLPCAEGYATAAKGCRLKCSTRSIR